MIKLEIFNSKHDLINIYENNGSKAYLFSDTINKNYYVILCENNQLKGYSKNFKSLTWCEKSLIKNGYELSNNENDKKLKIEHWEKYLLYVNSLIQ